MAEIGFTNYFTMRKTGVIIAGLLCLAIPSVYIASERQRLVYYDPDITILGDKTYWRPMQRTQLMSNSQKRKDITGQEKRTISDFTEYISSAKSSVLTKESLPELSKSTSVISTTEYESSSSLSLASVSSVVDSKRFSIENETTSEKAESRQLQITKKRENEILYNRNYLNVSQDFIPVVIDSNKTIVSIRTDFGNIASINMKDENFATSAEVHQARIKRIQDMCKKKNLFLNTMYKGNTRTVLYDSPNYNFTYCKVPKSGSTFWSRVFVVLRHGVDDGEKMFKLARSQVHSNMGYFKKDLLDVIQDKSRTVLVSRDPYSRLFSAYIDKSFLLLMNKLNYHIRQIPDTMKSNASCPTDLTFQEFLDWIISEGKQGNALNRHWSPIFSLCHPCEINSFILVKQETFAKDVEFALNQVGVEQHKLDYITLAVHDHRAELSLPGIIDTAFNTAKNVITRTCLGFLKYARRIWISLQIQGFINEQNKFPLENFNRTNYSNSTYFTEIVLQTLRDYPMDSKQSKQQRYQYLYQAYKTIKPETIQGLQELYRQDFELFGYNNLPPTEQMEI